MKWQSYVFIITCISSDILRSLLASSNCSSFPCENEALCEDTTAGYQCYCVDGYAGSNCEINFDDCSSAPCLNSATCVDDVAAYRCLCQPGFTGENCQVNIDKCQSNPCLREGMCIDLINGFICDCPVPYKGDNCSLLTCDTAPCENGAVCYDDVTFNYTTQGYFCDCVSGFTGLQCEVNIDDCNSTACSGQGICVDGVGDYSCLCEPGFVGDDCQFSVNDCAGNECRNNATCHDLHMGYWCECLVPGYEGLLCERERDECTSWGPCQNGGTCVDEFNGYSCHCTENWNGINCTEEVNRCFKNPCLNNAGCIDLSDGFLCQCQPFYTGRLCETAFNPCAPDYSPCQNEAECIAPPDGQYRCFCQTGFTGQQCEVNVNECLSFPCHNNATCEDILGGYVCHCMTGWTGQNCLMNIDDCVDEPCQNEGGCVDLVNRFECNCTEHYTGRLCEELYDYCQSSPCHHDSTCSLVVGGYQCHCLPTYTGEQCLDVIDACESEPCHNNGSCVNLSPGFYCNCVKPFTGLTCEDTISYCASEPCLNDGLCRDGIEDFFCICPRLLTGKQCTDLIDYCEGRPCKNDGICLNSHFTYRCICAYGFEGVNCTDMVDFCDENPCQNSGNCSNIPGGYKCECTDLFYGKFCESILPTTTHGVSHPLSTSTHLLSISPTPASYIIEVSSLKPTGSSKLPSSDLSSEIVSSSYIYLESTYTDTALLSTEILKFTETRTLSTRRIVLEGFSSFLTDMPSSAKFASTSQEIYGSSVPEMSGQSSISLSEKEEHTISTLLPQSYTELTSSAYTFPSANSRLTESKYETVITESVIMTSFSSAETFLTLPSVKSTSLELLLSTNTDSLTIPSISLPSLSNVDYSFISRTSSDTYSESSVSRELHPITSMSTSSLYKNQETIHTQTILTEYAVGSTETVVSVGESQVSESSFILKSVEHSGLSVFSTLSESPSATAPLYFSASMLSETVDRTKSLRISILSSLTATEKSVSFVKTDFIAPLRSELSSSVLGTGLSSFSATTHTLPAFTKLSSNIVSTLSSQVTLRTKSLALTLLSSRTVSFADTKVELTEFTALTQLSSKSASPELTQLISETVSVDHTQHISRIISPADTQLTLKSTSSALTHLTSNTSTQHTQLSTAKTASPTVTPLASKIVYPELTHHTSGNISPTHIQVYSSQFISAVVTKSSETTFRLSPSSSNQYSSFSHWSILKEENATSVSSLVDFSKQSSEPLKSSPHASSYQGSILSHSLKSKIYTEPGSHPMSSYHHSLKSVQPSDQLRISDKLIASISPIIHVSSVTEQLETTPSFIRSGFDRATISPSASVQHQSNFQPTEILSDGSTEVLSSAPKSVVISLHSSISQSPVGTVTSSTNITPLSSVNEFVSASSGFISASYQTPDEIKSSIDPTYIGTIENLQSTLVIDTSLTKVTLSSTSSGQLPSVLTGISSGSVSAMILTADSTVMHHSTIHTSLVQSSNSLLPASSFNSESVFLLTLSSDIVLEKASSSVLVLPSELSVDALISISDVDSEGFSVIATTSVLLKSTVKQSSSLQVLSSVPMISSKADSVSIVSGLIGSPVSTPVADSVSIATGFMWSSTSTPRLSTDVFTTSKTSRTVTSTVAMTTDSPDSACETVNCYNGGVCKINGTAVCDCPSRFTRPHCETAITMPLSLFNGTSILEIENPDVNDSVIIQLSFKTLQDTGILLHYHLKPEPVTSVVNLQIVEGVLQLYFTCGSQSFVLNTRVKVNNAQLFTLTLRQTMVCQTSIDLVDNIEKQPLTWIIGTNQLTELDHMTRISLLLIGGLSEDLANENDINFTGCLGNIWLNGNPIWANDSLHKVELADCSSLMSEKLCEDVDCLNGGQCHVTMTSTGTISPACDCMVPYTGVRCETEILLYYPSFDGTSYLKYAPPSFHANQSNEIYMSVRPMAADGTLLVSASQSGGNVPKSFIYLYLEDGFIQYKFSCDGQTVGSVISKTRIKTDETMEVIIRQSWTSGPGQWCNAALIVNSVVSVSQPFLSIGKSQPLGYLFLGGTPRNPSLLQDLHDIGMTGLIGCVKDLQVNDLELDLVAMATEGINIGNCGISVCEHNPCENGATCHSSGENWYCDCVPGYTGRLCNNKLCVSNVCLHGGTCVVMETKNEQLCLCPLGRRGILCEEALPVSMPHFSGTLFGYTSFMAYENMVGMKYDFEIVFNMVLDNDTTTSSGSMFLMGSTASRSNGDLMALGVYKEYLVFQYNLGSGAASIWSAGPLDITLPHHTIQFGRHGREGWLKVDNQQTITGKSPGLLTVLNTENILYVGGTEVPSGTTFENGLKGCIYNLQIRNGGGDFVAPGSPPGSADYGRSVSQCSSLSCDQSPCQNEAHCLEVGPSVYCNCTEGWKGLFCTETITVCDIQHVCAEGATCLPKVIGGYECLCPLGRRGENCTEAITISDPKFVGEKSYMSFTPVYIKQKMDIRLQIKPAVVNGLLFYVAEWLHSYSGDFLSLALHDGKMEMRYHHGDQLIVMVSDLVMKVDSEEWYTVEAGRNTTHGYVSVNNQYIVAMTTGRMTYLDTATDFYLGGLPDLERINPSAVPNEPSTYEGCIREFIVNGKNYQLSEEGATDGRNIEDCDGTLCGYSVCANGGTCTVTTSLTSFSCKCPERYYGDTCEEPIECRDLNCLNGGCCRRHLTGSYGCSCPVSWTGPSCDIAVSIGSTVQLTRDSYIYYVDTDYETSNKTYTKLSLSFKTTELNGLLIWNGQSYSDEEDYFGLGLRDGRVQIVWNLGWYSRSQIITSNKYNDGQWHTVLIERHGQNLIMTVEGVEWESKAPGDFYNLDTHGHYFIGGFRDGSVYSKSLEFYTDTFQGCLRDLYINEGPVSFLQATDGWNVINC